ncbi:hypothetical protein L228DRAFT_263981 [Xylona heveae TC161]|uniref:Zn(2)-C6 fungal-type domain-containing protein n=1 Tax=Xylona heveae (strain CBS 132557 / TC161) TaxID=1328760 RepID=A0A164ZKW2_XYLHT|nr:hypothetical protein L228DRAFT_263981 [Xylona heveae TC161]KZF19224.1 hypothetical protein L228DRAFT_263981 [Xylona heveae TC161]
MGEEEEDQVMTPPSGEESSHSTRAGSVNRVIPRRNRNRISLSCTECRARKVKCNRARPCNHCIKRNCVDKCVYITNRKARPAQRAFSDVYGRAQSPLANGTDDPSDSKAPHARDRIDRLEKLVLHLMSENVQMRDARGLAPMPTANLGGIQIDRDMFRDADISLPFRGSVSAASSSEPFSPHEVSSASINATDEDTARALGVMRSHRGILTYWGASHWAMVPPEMADFKGIYGHTKPSAAHLLTKKKSQMKLLKTNPELALCGGGLDMLEGNGNSILIRFPFSTLKPVTKARMLQTLPERKTVDSLVDRFFSFFNRSYHVLHEPTFHEEYNAFWINYSKPDFDAENVDFGWLSLLFAIIALAVHSNLGSVNIPREPWESALASAFSYIRATEQCLFLSGNFTRKPTPSTLTAMILVFFARRMRVEEVQGSLWVFHGAIARMALSMGLHRDPKPYGTIPASVSEVRRRLWATVLCTDILGSLHIGLPSTMYHVESNSEMPLNIHDHELSREATELPPGRPLTEYTGTSFLIIKTRLSLAFASIVAQTTTLRAGVSYEDILKWDYKLKEILSSSPDMLRLKPLVRWGGDPLWLISQRCALDILYQKALLALHTPYTLRFRNNMRFATSYQASVEAAVALLQHTVQLYQVDSSLLDQVEWLTESLLTHDVLHAAVIVCFAIKDLTKGQKIQQQPQRPQEPQQNDQSTATPTAHALAGELRFSKDDLFKVLHDAEDIYADWKKTCLKASLTFNAVSCLIGKAKEPDHCPGPPVTCPGPCVTCKKKTLPTKPSVPRPAAAAAGPTHPGNYPESFVRLQPIDADDQPNASSNNKRKGKAAAIQDPALATADFSAMAGSSAGVSPRDQQQHQHHQSTSPSINMLTPTSAQDVMLNGPNTPGLVGSGHMSRQQHQANCFDPTVVPSPAGLPTPFEAAAAAPSDFHIPGLDHNSMQLDATGTSPGSGSAQNESMAWNSAIDREFWDNFMQTLDVGWDPPASDWVAGMYMPP